MPQPTQQSNDAYARSVGFPNAATMLAYQNKQRQRLVGTPDNVVNQPFSMDTIKQALALHPAVMYQNILDRLNQVM